MKVDRRGFLAALAAAPFAGCVQPAATPATISGTKTLCGPVRVIGRTPYGFAAALHAEEARLIEFYRPEVERR